MTVLMMMLMRNKWMNAFRHAMRIYSNRFTSRIDSNTFGFPKSGTGPFDHN